MAFPCAAVVAFMFRGIGLPDELDVCRSGLLLEQRAYCPGYGEAQIAEWTCSFGEGVHPFQPETVL